MKKAIIEFSLIDESRTRTEKEIINDITQSLNKEEIIIPWCNKIENISITSKENQNKKPIIKLFEKNKKKEKFRS
jgi:hypothetical protein